MQKLGGTDSYHKLFVDTDYSKKIKKGSLPVSFLQELYDLIEEGDFVLDELDRNFIEFMFSHVRYSSDMNENIRQLKERHLEYDYRNTIRY